MRISPHYYTNLTAPYAYCYLCVYVYVYAGGSQVSLKTDRNKTSKILAGLELCVAVYEGDLNYLRGLLESGCPVDAADYDFRTAAHICCAENLVQAALILYEFKADFTSDSVRDRWGRTPIEEADNHGHVHLSGYYLSYNIHYLYTPILTIYSDAYISISIYTYRSYPPLPDRSRRREAK